MSELLSIINLLILVAGFAVVFWVLKSKKGEKIDQQALLLLQDRINEISRTLDMRLKENRESFERTTQGIHNQISNFTTGVTKMSEDLKQVGNSVKEVTTFQQIFRTPKLRGRWGELALEHELSQNFPKEMFELQYFFSNGEAVDAILKLPDGKLLPIDAKFPYEHFERMIEAENDETRESEKKSFVVGIKKEIDDIAGKYILPSEGTTDVAFMYIPAEAVYFEIIKSISELFDYARSKRILLTSPNTFYLMLQVIQQWARDLQMGRKTQEFIKKMDRIILDAQKLSQSFDKLGKHLGDARSSYEDSDKRLGLLVERTEKLVELGGNESEQLE